MSRPTKLLAAICCSLALGQASLRAESFQVSHFALSASARQPEQFRISFLSDDQHWLQPRVFKAGLFQRSGRPVIELDRVLGVQDGRLVLVEHDWGKWTVVGDASNLDDVRPLPGWTVEGHHVLSNPSDLFMVEKSHWTVQFQRQPGTTSPEFTGKVVTPRMVTELLLEGVRQGPSKVSPGNIRVLASYWSEGWNRLTYGPAEMDPKPVVGQFVADFVEPVQAVQASFTPEGRKAWNMLLSEVEDSLMERIRFAFQKDRSYYDQAKEQAIFPAIAQHLQGLRAEP